MLLLPLKIKLCMLLAVPVLAVPSQDVIRVHNLQHRGYVCVQVQREAFCYNPRALDTAVHRWHSRHVAHLRHVLRLEHLAHLKHVAVLRLS